MVAEPDATLRSVPMPRFDRTRLERAFAVLDGQVARGELPAAVLAVAGPSGPSEVRAFGVEDDRRVGTQDRFLVASITKPIVATTVLQLVEEGAISLAEPIRRLVPEFEAPAVEPGRPGGEVVSAWHLLTHTSGVVDVDIANSIEQRPTAADLRAGVLERSLAFVPGTAYRYASDSFYLLAELVRRTDGSATYADSLEARLLAPLGMTATSFDRLSAGHHTVAVHVVGLGTDLVESSVGWFESLQSPGGGLWSTADDLVRFGRATLLGGTLGVARILGRPFIELMAREHTAGIFEAGEPPRRPAYGLGWAVGWADGRMPGSPGQVGHMGATGSRLWVDPSAGLVIALLANRWGSEQRLSDAVVAAVYGALES